MMDGSAAMSVATAMVEGVGTERPAAQLAGGIRAQLQGGSCDLLLLFASAHFESEFERIAVELLEELAPRAFIGTTSETVIGSDREYEGLPAIAAWAAHLPGVRVHTFHLSQADVERLETPADWHDHLGVSPADDPYFLLLADPFSINALLALDRLDGAYPSRPALGGLASAGEAPRENILIFDGHALREGMVGAALSGAVQIDTIVSQGCRPIGRSLVITRAEKNVIYQLGGRPPLNMVTDVLRHCTSRDVELARSHGLLVGRVINESQGRFSTGDFLIRNPLGFDSSTGAMAVSDFVRAGQTIQFQVRDADSAAQELAVLLSAAPCERAAGALVFTCNGRGTRLFNDRSHDARALHAATHGVPQAGCFCAGEIGPIGGRNYLHGHTASIALIRPAGAAHA